MKEHSAVRQSVVARVLLSYALVVLGSALVATWSVLALRSGANEAALMRSGYHPLALAVRDFAAQQDIYNSQLNHITTARNPADLRAWLSATLTLGRPKMFGKLKAAIGAAFPDEDNREMLRVRRELLAEVGAIERWFAGDQEPLGRLLDAIARRDDDAAELLRDELVERGARSSSRLVRLETRVEHEVDQLLNQARGRERLALGLLIVFSGVSLLVGLLMALYARRVLRPLAAVTERAKSVAGGDLEPHAPIVSGDEIGELSTTFEAMVSAIARANEQLVQNERLATIGKMAAHVTHEIRNPLSSIALNLELLEDELGAQGDEARGLLRAISGEVERLNALSQQYLSFARQKSVGMFEEDLAELVREACDFVRREFAKSEVQLTFECESGIGPVRLDEGQIKQALFNLLRNARDAMPHGGTVQVFVRSLGDAVEITIEDEGVGLDQKARERLFEPFFTTKRHGTGLGLPITRKVVEAHGGSIEFSDRSPRGTRVSLRLPRQSSPKRSEPDLQLASAATPAAS
ncbi:MAG TPA: ATP-binding protein [Polyangiaceae bacterium]|nr:ATP-binding protein [Polyangiaceae bacterium]